MWIRSLHIAGVRCLEDVRLSPVDGLNVLVGRNGAGKSSVLEAISLLAGGKSFRSARIDAVVSQRRGGFEVFAEVESRGGVQRLGISRLRGSWNLRIDGESVGRLGRLTELFAATFFEPDSHELLAGGSEGRRRFLDWGVFHVEHGYGAQWSRYQRALHQRNALLKQGAGEPGEWRVWNKELADAGEPIAEARARFVEQYKPTLEAWCSKLAPELGELEFRLQRGWSDESLDSELAVAAERDRILGYTTRGPHRADWTLRFRKVGGRDELSRGQLKLACFALSRAMVDIFQERRRQPPVACLDDLFSELDSEHQARCLQALDGHGIQVWVTGTEVRSSIDRWSGPLRVFHVEHGRVTTTDG